MSLDRNGPGTGWQGADTGGSSGTPTPPGGDTEPRRDGRTLGQLFRELSHEASALVRAEAALARSELGDTVGEARKSATPLGIGVAMLLGGFLTLLACAVLALART